MLMITKQVSLAFEESRKGVLYGMRASVREQSGVCIRQGVDKRGSCGGPRSVDDDDVEESIVERDSTAGRLSKSDDSHAVR